MLWVAELDSFMCLRSCVGRIALGSPGTVGCPSTKHRHMLDTSPAPSSVCSSSLWGLAQALSPPQAADCAVLALPPPAVREGDLPEPSAVCLGAEGNLSDLASGLEKSESPSCAFALSAWGRHVSLAIFGVLWGIGYNTHLFCVLPRNRVP